MFSFLLLLSFTIVSEHSLVLKEVKVPLWPHGKCQSALRRNFGTNYVLPKTNICAGEEGNDACDVSYLQFDE